MPSYEDLFVKDDVTNSEENRLNHVLFGLFLDDGFRGSVLECLGLPRDSVIYKPTTWRPSGLRPDFAVEAPDRTTAAYIEVELDQDSEQVRRYREEAEDGVPVFSFGRAAHQGHQITLDGLVKLAQDAAQANVSAQLDVMVMHLQKQVDESRGGRGHPGPISPEALQTPLGRALRAGGMVNWGEERPRPGKFFARAQSQHGISVCVASEVSPGKPVTPFYVQSGRAVCFLGYDELKKDLSTERLDRWADFIEEELGGDIRNRVGRNRCPIELSTVEQHLDGLLDGLRALVGMNPENHP